MKRYVSEALLIEKIQSGEIGWKEYVLQQSKELHEEYMWYCDKKKLDPQSEESAVVFLEAQEKAFDEAIERGDI